eukprot:435313-Pyramimonas_sp.AAC.1
MPPRFERPPGSHMALMRRCTNHGTSPSPRASGNHHPSKSGNERPAKGQGAGCLGAKCKYYKLCLDGTTLFDVFYDVADTSARGQILLPIANAMR